MSVEDEYWDTALGAWIRDLIADDAPFIPPSSWRQPRRRSLPLQYSELTDGVVLTLLFHEIEPTSVEELLIVDPSTSRDNSCRQLFALLDAIRFFYKSRLQQLVVIAPPDIYTIVRSLRSDESGEELNKFLLLLLGCAVHCEKKKSFVERITRLAAHTQKGLAQHIQTLTQSNSVVLPVASSSDTNLMFHLEKVMKERDVLVQQVLQIGSQEHESDEGSSNTAASSLNGDIPQRNLRYDRRSPSPNGLDRHCTVELASMKAEIRKLRNETEDKDEEINELKDELEIKEAELRRLQEERLGLVKDARDAKDLRDEMECMQHKIAKTEKLEKENIKLREKVTELDFYQSRIEQVREHNEFLEKTISLLEDEKESLEQKIKSRSEIEVKLEDCQETVKSLQADICEKNKRIEQLLLDQSNLESELMARNASMNCLDGNTSFTPRSPRESLGSLAEQLEQSERSEIAKLRLEVKRLRSQLNDSEEQQSDRSTTEKSCANELRGELDQKSREIAELREENEVVTRQLHELEKTLSSINSQYKEAAQELDTVRAEREQAVKSLHDTRRKFAQMQNDLNRKFEMEILTKTREHELEVTEAQRRLHSVQEEREETDKLLTRLREEQKQLRVTVDDLKEELRLNDHHATQTERALKNAENERNTMKEKAEKLEAELESVRMRILTAEDAAKRLENSEKNLVQQTALLGEAEAENRALQQQLELETKKTQRLREDLVLEKTKGADLVGRLKSLCAAVALNGGKIDTEMDDIQLIESIDDVIMTALNAAKREADASRLQQHTQLAELADLRRDIEMLRRSESASLVESDDRVRELNKENINMKEQIFLLQEKVRELQIEVSSKNSEVAVARREIEELNRNATAATASNTELARLQVSLRNLQLQEELLKQDNTELRSQLDLAEKSRFTAKKDADTLAAMHQALLSDHDRLQNLHDLLTQDYERAKDENQDMKLRLRNSRPSPVVMPTRELEELRTNLAQERALRDNQLRGFADLQNEHGAAKRELDAMRKENECLARNCENLSADIRALKLAEQSHRATIRELTATADELTRTSQQKQLELEKLQHRIEMLTQLNRTYDEESKNLARQVEMLLQQNKELLNRALNDKDHYHQEQKDFQERLAALRRHKEKLEEKIMDQYRSMENKRVMEKSKQPLVKRAAKALINRRRPSQPSSNGSTTEDSSTYSADEAPLQINGHEEFDLFPPTCSSSEDQDRASPRYETIINFKDSSIEKPSPFRARNDLMGGSVRVYPTARNSPIMNCYSFNERTKTSENERTFSERGVDIPTYLPPRAPIRNSSTTASLRARPPPPPYNKNRNMAPTVQPQLTSSPVHHFTPAAASTPKSGSPVRENNRPVVDEGELRTFIRDKEERVDKAMSIYENVTDPSEVRPNDSTVWYEYGCV